MKTTEKQELARLEKELGTIKRILRNEEKRKSQFITKKAREFSRANRAMLREVNQECERYKKLTRALVTKHNRRIAAIHKRIAVLTGRTAK